MTEFYKSVLIYLGQKTNKRKAFSDTSDSDSNNLSFYKSNLKKNSDLKNPESGIINHLIEVLANLIIKLKL
jgi:hypothetical protein